MCWRDHAPEMLICGHPGPEGPITIRECKKDPCVTGGVIEDNQLASTRRRYPCEDCKANGAWVKVPGSINKWVKAKKE